MRDEIDARIRVDNHQGFADGVDRLFAAVRAGFSRLPTWDGSSQHLFALIASFAITAISFNATAV